MTETSVPEHGMTRRTLVRAALAVGAGASIGVAGGTPAARRRPRPNRGRPGSHCPHRPDPTRSAPLRCTWSTGHNRTPSPGRNGIES
ncbi:hypothetical protein [Micromonospora sp. NPDC049240]|uniref:hypothetical protein n=1 Tax=Micromonospora sp. NPDC049240 TaxID=3155151 RepID=UPI0033F68BE4